MIDLEEEFTKLSNVLFQHIQRKESAGELSFNEAQELRQMVQDRIVGETDDGGSPKNWESSSWCAELEDDSSWECSF